MSQIPGINAYDKPVANDFEYVYAEDKDKGFRKVTKAMMKVLLGVATNLSELTNDKGFVDNTVSNLKNYYLKTETYSKEELDDKIALIPKFSVKVVYALPFEDISESTIYLVPANDGTENLYTEYINVNGLWEILGTQKVPQIEVTKESIESALGYTPADEQKLSQLQDTVNDKVTNPTSGAVGQILEIETVDENGKPKTYKAVDKPQGGAGSGGQDGEDGFSPIATVTQTETGATISIEDKNGTTTAEIYHGKNGKDGQDGYTPQKGKDYFDGQDGKDGQNGQDGKTPVKGTDYFTEADKQEIVEDVLEQIEIPEGGGSSGGSTEGFKEIFRLVTTEEVGIIETGIDLSQYSEIFAYCDTVTADGASATHFDWYFSKNVSSRISSSLNNTQMRVQFAHIIKLYDNKLQTTIGYGTGNKKILDTNLNINSADNEVSFDKLQQSFIVANTNDNFKFGSYGGNTMLKIGTKAVVYGRE